MEDGIDDFAEWRLEYGRLFTAALRGDEYTFRPLTIDEYNYIIACESYDSQVDSEAIVVQTALLDPGYDYVESQPAGVITSLASEILSSSGFASVEIMQQYLQEYRQLIAENLIETMCATIISAIPTYSVEQLKSFTLDRLLYLVAMSEQVIRFQQESMQNEIMFSIEPQQEEATEEQPKQSSGEPPQPGSVRSDDPIARKLFGEG